jgi:hypothetical protein
VPQEWEGSRNGGHGKRTERAGQRLPAEEGSQPITAAWVRPRRTPAPGRTTHSLELATVSTSHRGGVCRLSFESATWTVAPPVRLVALGTAPGATRRAPVRNRASRARTGVLQYPRYVQFQARVPQMESSPGHALRPLLAPPRLAVVGPRQERKGERRCRGSRERKMAGHRNTPGRRGAGAVASRGRRERSRGRAMGSATTSAREELRHLLRLRCISAGAEGGEEPDPDPAGRTTALAPAAAGGSLEMGSSRPSRLCAAPEMGSSSRSSRPAQAGEPSTTARRTGVPQPPPVAAARLPWPPPSSESLPPEE